MRIRSIIFFSIYLAMDSLCFSQVNHSQKQIDSLKNVLERSMEEERVDLLNQIALTYEDFIPDSAWQYAQSAEMLAAELYYNKGRALANIIKGNYFVRTSKFPTAITEYDKAIRSYTNAEDKSNLLNAYYLKGRVLRMSGDFDQALDNFLESLKISEEVGDKKGIAYAYLNIGIIYSTRLGESEEKGLPYFFDALEISHEINDPKCISYALNNIALVYIDLKEYNKALEYHHQSLKLKQAAGDKAGIASSLGNIGDVYTLMDDYETSMKYNQQALTIYREIDDQVGIVYTILELAYANIVTQNFDKAASYLEEALIKVEDINSLQLKSGAYNYMYKFHLAQNEYKKALEFYKKYTIIEDSIYSENSNQQIARMQTLHETEKKEAAITQLTNEKTIQELKLKKSQNLMLSFIVAAILIFALAILIYYGYRQKQKANKFLEERNKFEIENRKKAINLFGQQVSKEVALELLSDSFKSGSKKLLACIMFLDIRDFTPFAENKEPSDIIKYQNDVFGFMIDIVSRYHGIINQFVGYGFMATFGAPVSSGNDSQNAVDASMEIINTLKEKCGAGLIPETRVGIGLHTGFIVTGNVGTAERKQYSITGNTVILASRIEQLNKKFKSEILVSGEVIERLDPNQAVNVENLGELNIKGRTEPIEIHRLV